MARCLGPADVLLAAELLKRGEIVAFPTETVYGLGARLFHQKAVASIFKVKGRAADNPLIAHISSLDQVSTLAVGIPPAFYALAVAFWPGPLAIILRRASCVPLIATAGLDSIAVRMPAHSLACQLIERVGEPLVAPSANLSGRPSATQAKHVIDDFDGKIAAVIDGGKANFGIESTVISLLDSTPVLLRPGVITKQHIEQVLGRPVQTPSTTQGPVLSPGMKYRHYAPNAPLYLLETREQLNTHLAAPVQGRRLLLSRLPLEVLCPQADLFFLSSKELYSLLRYADEKKYAEIVVYCDDELQKDVALMNRLKKAAGRE